MYKKTTRCNKCKHYDTENHKCDAFCSFIKETCDDVYQHGRADKYQEITSEYMLLTEKQVADIRADAIEEVCKQISERVEYWDSCAKAMEKGSNEYKIFISLAKNFDEFAEQLKEQEKK